jgi:isoquinoline 1-oxidoreductase/isoquinoline 1-oxidoreductase beta subunit
MTTKNSLNISAAVNIPTTRRQLIKNASLGAGSLSLGLALPGCSTLVTDSVREDGSWDANAWLTIESDDSVVFTLDRVEMGQGTYTGLTTLIAEELDIAPSEISVVFAPASKEYRNRDYGIQITGGSNSLSSSWVALREIGATARQMILAAAAQVFQVSANQLETHEGRVVQSSTGRSLSYGGLASLAAKQDVPDDLQLRHPADFKYIGKQNQRLDSHLKVTGKANFGIDARQADMSYAIIVRAPYIGATLESHNGDLVTGLPGVSEVLEVSHGMAIVADSYWKARKAQEKLSIKWRRNNDAPVSTEQIFEQYKQAAIEDSGNVVRDDGDVQEALESAETLVDQEYKLPFLAHATMEPMNCVADVKKDRADIWTSTQAPDLAQVAVAKVTDLSLDEVFIHNQFIGGGFGRRLSQDFVGEAAEISYKTGRVIKLIWSREDDTRNDLYRPASYHRLRAAVNKEQGVASAWDHQIVCPKIMDWYVWDAAPATFPWAPKFMYTMLGHAGLLTEGSPMTPADTSPYEGAKGLPYSIPSLRVRHTKSDAGVPVSYWRSVGHSHNAFVTECFLDELAAELGKDPYHYRRELLRSSPRMLAVLDAAAKQAGWGRKTDDGVFQGIAAHESFGSYVAEVVELKVERGEIQVLKVVCAIDCGTVVNPDVVRMQMESCVIFGLTAALYGEITIADGSVEQSNFHDYQMVRMNQSPLIETVFIDSIEPPTGVGEPGLPPLAPAMAGALYAATGERYRRLPFNVS